MSLKKKNFYDKEIHPHKDLNTVNATFFKDIEAQNRMDCNAFILKTEAEVKVCSKMEGNEKYPSFQSKNIPFIFSWT